MAPVYKLTYFDIRGLAETSRFILKYGGIEFEDERIPRDKWADVKANYEYGQLPVLTIDGKAYNQSTAINRYLAKQTNLAGSNDLETLEIDAVTDTITDFRLKFSEFFREQDPIAKEAKKAAFLNEQVPYFLSRLEKRAEANNGYLVANKLTWADMYLTNVAQFLISLCDFDFGSTYPNIDKVRQNVLNLPAIKEWVEVRPKSDM